MQRLDPSVAKLAVPGVVVCVLVIVALLQAPFPQPQSYHVFADQGAGIGIPNLLNVLSNLPFAVVGVAGLYYCYRYRSIAHAGIFAIIFSGVFLAAFGSAYYHWSPDNQTLVWDRLPMSIAFMGFFTYVLTDRVGDGCRRLLWPFLLLGIASVGYWAWTESLGEGDLRFYALVQFVPLMLTPLILYLFPGSTGDLKYYVGLLLCYGLAKLLEYLDYEVWELVDVISGHSLKHIAAAAGTYYILLLLKAYGARELARHRYL